MWEYNYTSETNDYLIHYGVRGMKWDPDKLKRKGQYAYDAAKGKYNAVKKSAQSNVQKAYGTARKAVKSTAEKAYLSTTYGKASAREKKYSNRANAQGKKLMKNVKYNPVLSSVAPSKTLRKQAKNAQRNYAKAEIAGLAKTFSSPKYKAISAVNKAKRTVGSTVRKTTRKVVSATGTGMKVNKAKRNMASAKATAKTTVSNVKNTAKNVAMTPKRKITAYKNEKRNEQLRQNAEKARNRSLQQRQVERNKQQAKTLQQRAQKKKQRNTTQKSRIKG